MRPMCTTTPEQLELDAHRDQLQTDVMRLVEKYRAIFEWDVPAIDEPLADRLIIAAIRQALDGVESGLGINPGER
jgi:hypothetical protein